MLSNPTIIAELKYGITDSGLSHEQLADLSGVPIAVIDRFMDRDGDVSFDTAARLAFCLGMGLRHRGATNEFCYYPSGELYVNERDKIKARKSKKGGGNDADG